MSRPARWNRIRQPQAEPEALQTMRLSINLPGHRIAACLGKAALKTHALQTLPRGPLTRPRARSVWSAPDLSALFVRRGTACGFMVPMHAEIRMKAFHEPQGAAGILPAEEPERSSADETSA